MWVHRVLGIGYCAVLYGSTGSKIHPSIKTRPTGNAGAYRCAASAAHGTSASTEADAWKYTGCCVVGDVAPSADSLCPYAVTWPTTKARARKGNDACVVQTDVVAPCP